MALAMIPGLKFIISCPFFCGAVLYLVDESQVILNLASPLPSRAAAQQVLRSYLTGLRLLLLAMIQAQNLWLGLS